jgi:hypothetical protein
MLRRLLLALPLAAACEAGPPPQYSYNDLQLLTGYTAKELCSCLFVIGQDEDYCREWTRATPEVASYRIDPAAKSVRAQSILFWGARARFVNDADGCVLE